MFALVNNIDVKDVTGKIKNAIKTFIIGQCKMM